eukprot:GHVL01003118.1.p1 GENE.GHVL01003118.1~~GHVL01003118.1.p1  ORF type:complete len:441 (-),score=144.56 GHVL01003118.1:131-1453(-)
MLSSNRRYIIRYTRPIHALAAKYKSLFSKIDEKTEKNDKKILNIIKFNKQLYYIGNDMDNKSLICCLNELCIIINKYPKLDNIYNDYIDKFIYKINDNIIELDTYDYILYSYIIRKINIKNNELLNITFNIICNDIARRFLDMNIYDRINLLYNISSYHYKKLYFPPIFITFLRLFTESIKLEKDINIYLIIKLLKSFSKINMKTTRLKEIYDYLESNLLRIYEYNINKKNNKDNIDIYIHLLYTMINTKLYSTGCIEILLNIICNKHLNNYNIDSIQLKSLKIIELCLRLELSGILSYIPSHIIEYLSYVNDIKYYDKKLNKYTILSYQLYNILEKHNFICKSIMEGPYALQICDPIKRIYFECIEIDQMYENSEIKFNTLQRIRHLKLTGWKVVTVNAIEWHNLKSYSAKALFVKNIIQNDSFIKEISPMKPNVSIEA